MRSQMIIVESYFDGERHWQEGPYAFVISQGRVADIVQAEGLARSILSDEAQRAAFLMPGLVDSHVHMFLDGGQLDANVRSDYLKAPIEEMQSVAERNAQSALACGVTLVRDAGDRYGVNHWLRGQAVTDPGLTAIRSAGMGLKRPKRYGAFMGKDVASADEIIVAVHELATDCDDIKLILTGIIDFDAGQVNGAPQFDVDAATLVVSTAHGLGKRVFAHSSGSAGLEVAIAARVDSIEHGFFMRADLIKSMADRGIAWTPTFAPVHFQWARPEVVGWSAQTVANIARILDGHAENLVRAEEAGVTLLCGSDAGSHGVAHGDGLLDELQWMHEAGLSVHAVLNAATAAPRQHWGEPVRLVKGAPFDAVLLNASPFDEFDALRRPTAVFRHGRLHRPARVGDEVCSTSARQFHAQTETPLMK